MTRARCCYPLILLALWAPGVLAMAPETAPRIVPLNLSMPRFQRQKQVWVYLPPGYHEETIRRFPVVYMLDGQDLFATPRPFRDDPYIETAMAERLHRKLTRHGSWRVDMQLDRLHREGKIPGVIVVGISSADANRTAEYSPWRWAAAPFPEGERYVSFLVETLKPAIDRRFRTLGGREHTAIMGSSMGGVMALYAGLRHPAVFARVGAFSPLLTPRVFGDRLRDYLADYQRGGVMRIYVDLGREEAGFGPLRPIRRALLGCGFGEQEIWFREGVRGGHRVEYWGQRFPVALLWLMGS